MISLENYIDYKSMQFNDELYAHICAENNEYPVNESRGIPDGLEDDATYIAKIVYSLVKKNDWHDFAFDVDLAKLNLGKMFDSIQIQVKVVSTNIEGGSETPKIFTKDMLITLMISKDVSLLDIKTQIAHELIHCYVYVINGTTNMSDVSKFFDRISKISYKYVVSNYESQEDLIRFIVYALMYYFNDDEINAFVGELQVELKEKSPRNMKDAYKILYSSKIYNIYLVIYNAFENNVNNYEKWCDVYREMNIGDKNLTNAKIMHKIRKKFEYIKLRFFKIIPRVVKESLYEGTIDHSPETFFEKLKEFGIPSIYDSKH